MSTPSHPSPPPFARQRPDDAWPYPGHALEAEGQPPLRLWRSRTNRVLGGVLGGLAEKFDLEARPVRLLYAVLIVMSGGIALVPYLAYWAVTRVPGPPTSPPGLWRSPRRKLVAGVLGGICEKVGIPLAVLRPLYAVLTVVTAVVPGVVTYLVLWSITRPLDVPDARRL